MPNSGERGRVLSLVVCVALILRFPEIARAQGETTSAVAGTVADASGAPIAGAIVTIVENETGGKRSASTDDAGRFNFRS